MSPKITARTLCTLRFAAQPRFSPDGRFAAFTVKNAGADEKGYESDLYVSREGGAPLRLTAGGDAPTYCWTREGTLLFPAARDKKDQERAARGERFSVFYEISPEGGEAVRAFELPIAADELTRLDDGRFYCVSRVDAHYPDRDAPDFEEKLKEYVHPTYRALEESPFWFNGLGFTDGMRHTLMIADRSGSVVRVTPEGFDVHAVSDDGARILYVGAAFDKVSDPWNTGLYLYDTRSAQTTELLAPGEIHLEYAYLMDEDRALVCATRGESYGHTQSGELFLLSLADRALRPLGDVPIVPAMGRVNTDARLGGGQMCKMTAEGFYYIALRGYTNVLCHVTPDGAVQEDLLAPHGLDAFDLHGGHMVYTLLSNAGLPEICWDGRAITDESRCLAGCAVSVPEYLPFTTPAGVELDGWLIRPVDYVPGRSYPAVYEIHGGPRTAFGDTFFHEMQLFASAGYFVFFCNPRGSDGKGDAFADIWGRYGSIDYDDLMAFCDHVLAVTPDIDARRVGVLGGSYGGYMTNWIIGHTDRFAAACSQRSIASWISFEFTSDIGARFTLSQHRTSTQENVQALWDISPLKYADRCKTPTLFIHSDHDFRCWMVEGIQMFTALKMHGVPARLCLFADETHELSRSGRPENRLARLEEMLAWFDQYLKGEEQKND